MTKIVVAFVILVAGCLVISSARKNPVNSLDYGTYDDQPDQSASDRDDQDDQLIKKLEKIIEPKNDESDRFDPDDLDSDTTTAKTTLSSSKKTSVTSPGSFNQSTRPPYENENVNNSWTVFFLLCILAFSVLLIHFLIKAKFHYLPESVAVVFMGASIGLVFKLLAHWQITDWSKEETFTPTVFFLVFLPPIIFESGYNLHKGNFFQNIGSILVFAIFGTAISAFVMGAGVYVLGKINLTYSLNAKESFAFGSLVSAVDPVATLAIFNALDIDPVLYMLVFGESILNDAVAIVLTNTIITLSDLNLTLIDIVTHVIARFFLMFFASAGIGCFFGLTSALLFKLIDFRKTPSLEISFMLIFMYSPYVFAEAIHLSGIMAILFAGIVMSHYTHYNLSPVTRITIQQVFRTFAFISETCVFAYLGLAIFSFKHIFKPSLVLSSIVMCLVARACNIFPLATLLNYFREHKITKKMQFIMWFSGLRGAIAFALSLNLQSIDNETRHVIVTATLILVLFTTLVLGGSTLPMMKLLNANDAKNNRRRRKKIVFLSKTKEMGEAVDLINLIGPEEAESAGSSKTADATDSTAGSVNIHIVRSNGIRLRGFARLDQRFLRPFFTRKFTDEELRDGQSHMNKLTKQWFDEVNTDAAWPSRSSNTNDDDDDDDDDEENDTKRGKSKTNTVYFSNHKSKQTTKLGNKLYENLNNINKNDTNSHSNILLESTDEDDEDEEVVIDKQNLIK